MKALTAAFVLVSCALASAECPLGHAHQIHGLPEPYKSLAMRYPSDFMYGANLPDLMFVLAETKGSSLAEEMRENYGKIFINQYLPGFPFHVRQSVEGSWGTHTHSPALGLLMWQLARNEREKALALGYLSHIFADTISQNLYVPAKFSSMAAPHILTDSWADLMVDLLILDRASQGEFEAKITVDGLRRAALEYRSGSNPAGFGPLTLYYEALKRVAGEKAPSPDRFNETIFAWNQVMVWYAVEMPGVAAKVKKEGLLNILGTFLTNSVQLSSTEKWLLNGFLTLNWFPRLYQAAMGWFDPNRFQDFFPTVPLGGEAIRSVLEEGTDSAWMCWPTANWRAYLYGAVPFWQRGYWPHDTGGLMIRDAYFRLADGSGKRVSAIDPTVVKKLELVLDFVADRPVDVPLKIYCGAMIDRWHEVLGRTAWWPYSKETLAYVTARIRFDWADVHAGRIQSAVVPISVPSALPYWTAPGKSDRYRGIFFSLDRRPEATLDSFLSRTVNSTFKPELSSYKQVGQSMVNENVLRMGNLTDLFHQFLFQGNYIPADAPIPITDTMELHDWRGGILYSYMQWPFSIAMHPGRPWGADKPWLNVEQFGTVKPHSVIGTLGWLNSAVSGPRTPGKPASFQYASNLDFTRWTTHGTVRIPTAWKAAYTGSSPLAVATWLPEGNGVARLVAAPGQYALLYSAEAPVRPGTSYKLTVRHRGCAGIASVGTNAAVALPATSNWRWVEISWTASGEKTTLYLMSCGGTLDVDFAWFRPVADSWPAPTPDSPADGAQVPTEWGGFVRRPTPEDWPVSYRIQVATSSSFAADTIVHESWATSIVNREIFFATRLAPSSTYWWRAKSENLLGESAWTATRTFTTMALAPTPWLVAPAAGTTSVAAPVTLRWGGIELSVTDKVFPYDIASQVQVATRPDFSNATSFVVAGPGSCQLVLNQLAPGTTYSWRVRGGRKYGSMTQWSAWTSAWSFSTRPPIPAAPTLLKPAPGASAGKGDLLDWSNTPWATKYRLILRDTMTGQIVLDRILEGASSLPLPALVEGRWYQWQVIAGNATGWGPAASRTFRFLTQ